MIITTQDAVQFVAAFAVLLVAIVALLLVERLISRTKSPAKLTILRALETYAREAVAGAGLVAENTLASGEKRLESADKKAIADSFYALLPAVIHIGAFIVPIGTVKRVISQAEWEVLVQQASDEIDVKIKANEAWLAAQVAKLSTGTDTSAKD